MKRKLKVALACNIKLDHSNDLEAEFDEPETIEALKKAFLSGGYEPYVIQADDCFAENVKKIKPDIVFNIAEGRYGRSREGQIPAILEYLNIPFVGSDALALGLGLDKTLTKRLALSAGVPTPAFFLYKQGDVLPEDIKFPVIVKPNAEGSSKGISDASVCQNRAELLELLNKDEAFYKEDFLVESYIDGREFTVGILGNGQQAKAFEPMELIFHKLRGAYKVYSYEVKRNFQDYISYKCPPDLPEPERESLKTMALKVFSVLSCRDFARVDFRMDKDGNIYFIEVNPLPGLAPNYSDYPMLAGFNGVSYNEIVLAVLKEGLQRCGLEKEHE